MYNPYQDKLIAWLRARVAQSNDAWFTAGEAARACKMSVPTARRYLRNLPGEWDHLIDVDWQQYRSNASVQLFKVVSGK